MSNIDFRTMDKRDDWLLSDCKNLRSYFRDIAYANDNYFKEIFTSPGKAIINGAIFHIDSSGKFVNINHGLRKTCFIPKTYHGTVYTFGPSWCYGFGAEDSHTVQSFLQKRINEERLKYRVLNYGVRGALMQNIWLQISRIDFNKNDKVVIFFMFTRNTYLSSINVINEINNYLNKINVDLLVIIYPRIKELLNPSYRERILFSNNYEELLCDAKKVLPYTQQKYIPTDAGKALEKLGIRVVDTQPYFDRPNKLPEVFFDREHLGYTGNKILSDILYDYLFQNPLQEYSGLQSLKDIEREYLHEIIQGYYGHNSSLNKYLSNIKPLIINTHNLGSIVANCNPFTNGHKFLIKKALDYSDKIILFVLEENKSYFSFEDRMNMVKLGVEEFGNKVIVVPSGNFIISSFSFPGYFSKDTMINDIDPSLDVLLFSYMIAPILGIKTRYVGNEPICKVTDLYNNYLKKYLPYGGVNLSIIDRITVEGNVISASKVREFYKIKNWNEIGKYVPHSTLSYLKKII